MNKKQPFGINIAARVAAQAMKESIAPPSIILSKLFSIQKDTIFPEKLEVEHFRQTNYRMNDSERKATVVILEEMKKPNVNVIELLEEVLSINWVTKKMQPKLSFNQTKDAPKAFKKKKTTAKPSTVTTPDVIVKKSKLA